MKKCLFFFLTLPLICFSQTVFVDFKVIKNQEDYLALENIFKPYHQKMIAEGKMMAWYLCEVKTIDKTLENPPNYVTINVYKDQDQIDAYGKNWSLENLKKAARTKFKSSEINRVLNREVSVENRRYHLEFIDQTIQAGGDLKVGDAIRVGAMIQKTEDYEQVETQIYKPFVEEQILKGNHRWWGFNKITDRSENALQEFTHFTWNINVPGKQFDPYIVQNQYISDKLTEIVVASRDAVSATIEVIDRN